MGKQSFAADFANQYGVSLNAVIAGVLFLIANFFIWRSFYGMRIGGRGQK
jgi:hypothetical protein